ncbi:hypothetical protein L596_016195 [Steinernema carpocapsae]|uniref:Edg1 TPR repeats region domain-containing protein n=1 Tax=Steinernema carpocapsae TaxID=34508 RepID=A0A4V6A3D6_STECR|nr:hypothetical protein L596_016195 [Steinernema carpocapsae]
MTKRFTPEPQHDTRVAVSCVSPAATCPLTPLHLQKDDRRRQDRPGVPHCDREPNVDEECKEVLPRFMDHGVMKNEVLTECTQLFQKVFKKAPLTTLKKVFLKCALNHVVVSGVLRVLRATPKAIDFRLGEHCGYIAVFRWLLKQPAVDLKQDHVYQGFTNLVTNITKCFDDGQQKVELEVCKATELLAVFLVPMIFEEDAKRLAAMDIITRIFSSGTMARRTRIAWTSEEKLESVNPGLLTILLLELFETEYVKKTLKFRDLVIRCLESLGNRLQVDAYQIPDKYTQLIRNKMNHCEWMVKYCFVKWFRKVLCASLRPEIPVGIYKFLRKESHENYFVLNKPSTNLNDPEIEFMVSYFDLAFFNSDIALEFINSEKDICMTLYTTNLGLKLSKSLLVSADKFLSCYNDAEGLYRIMKPLEWLVEQLDPPRDYRRMYAEGLNRSMCEALRTIEPLLIVFDTVFELLLVPNCTRSERTKHQLFEFLCNYTEVVIRREQKELDDLCLQILPAPSFHEWDSAKAKMWLQCHVVTYFVTDMIKYQKHSVESGCIGKPSEKAHVQKMYTFITSTMQKLSSVIGKTEQARVCAFDEKEESRRARTFHAYARPQQNQQPRNTK